MTQPNASPVLLLRLRARPGASRWTSTRITSRGPVFVLDGVVPVCRPHGGVPALGVSTPDDLDDGLPRWCGAFPLSEVDVDVVLDAVGVGGRAGLGGDGTARHPAFATCGKGRKHASDGAAWTAAIAAAAEVLRAGRRVTFEAEAAPSSGRFAQHWRLGIELSGSGGSDGGAVWSTDDIADPGPSDESWGRARSTAAAPWVAAFAGVVLARLTGVAPDLRDDVLSGVEVVGDVAAWASLYNAALAALPAPDDSEPPGDTDRTPTEG